MTDQTGAEFVDAGAIEPLVESRPEGVPFVQMRPLTEDAAPLGEAQVGTVR